MHDDTLDKDATHGQGGRDTRMMRQAVLIKRVKWNLINFGVNLHVYYALSNQTIVKLAMPYASISGSRMLYEGVHCNVISSTTS